MMLTSPTTSSSSFPGSFSFGGDPLEVLISRACDPSLSEPNYSLHLEVAEYVNSKKANNPRNAAMYLARLANSRNPTLSLHALSLLSTLVTSCGYPFHLQVSTKEFLNELVRRFPERPPPFPSPVMARVLALISEWKETICVASRWKEDLGNIRDMYRLLVFKGYRFPQSNHSSSTTATSTTATSSLKTATELENEDREAQSAKLQELIRRGTPRDLAAAQELMKSLAGANPESTPDYREQALSELAKLESKVVLMNEMLDNVTEGEKFASGDAYDQVSQILNAARPKIQNWISDAESHDSQSLDTFLQLNDSINSTLTRYEAYKKGDFKTASNPVPQELQQPQQPISLIDWDDEQSSTAQPAAPQQPANGGVNDLAGLFSSPATVALTPAPVQIPSYAQWNNQAPASAVPPYAQWGNQAPASAVPAAIMLPATPAPANSNPNFFAGGQRPQQVPTPPIQPRQVQTPPLQPQAQPAAPHVQTQSQQAQQKDPFADLAGLF